MKQAKENTTLNRNPFPHDANIEAAVVGALMVEPKAILAVYNEIKPETFYVPEHQEIYRAIRNLHERDMPIDILTVTGELRKLGTLDKAGGPYMLARISATVAGGAHIQYHTAILTDLHVRRELIRESGEQNREAMDMAMDVADLIEAGRAALDVIEGNYTPQTQRGMKTLLADTLKEAQWRIENQKEGLTGISTGLDEMNKMTAGMQNGELILLAGRPSMGKTAISLCMAMEAAKAGKKVVYYSLEMAGTRLMDRWLIGETGIDPDKWKSGTATEEEIQKVIEAGKKLAELPITLDDNPAISIDSIFSAARLLRQKDRCDILFVDYLQLCEIKTQSKNSTRSEAIGEVTRKAKIMAKKLGIPVVLLSQLNRKPEGREDKRPELADLRDSGNIEQDADIVMLVHRPAQAGLQRDEKSGYPVEGMGVLIVAKNRNGKTGDVYFGHNASMTCIGDYTPPVNWMKENLKPAVSAKKLRERYIK